jgi:toxin ParE1/3/4
VKSKPAIARAQALADIDSATSGYEINGGRSVAVQFSHAMQAAFTKVRQTPGAGSPRWSQLLGIPNLRSTRLKKFPWLVFYIEQSDHLDIWRVLHAHSDIAGILDPDSD